VIILKNKEKPDVDLFAPRYDLKIIGIPSEIALVVNKFTCKSIKLETIIDEDKK